jgi:hypothetical protein
MNIEHQLNAWRELGDEMERIVSFMSASQRDDLLPDWFAPRLRQMLEMGATVGAVVTQGSDREADS